MIRKLFTLSLLCVLSLILYGCDAANKQAGIMLSPELAKKQMLHLTDPRLNWAKDNNNYMVQTFDTNWQIASTDKVETYSQARQVYLFAKGYDVTKEPRYLHAMVKSTDLMLETMFDETRVLWHSSINRNDTEKRYGPTEYSTSFALFAMAHAYRVSHDKRYLDAALKTWMLGELSMGLTMARASQQGNLSQASTDTWSINPLMHLFEALLVLYDVTQSPSVWQDIEFTAQFVEEKLLQQEGYLAEYYVNVDAPLPIGDGGYIELGHQIEWAYLLHSAVDKGLDSRFRKVAERLYDFATIAGWDSKVGSLSARSDYEGNLIVAEPVWWAQAELMRLLAYKVRMQSSSVALVGAFAKSCSFTVNNYLDQNSGGWLDNSQKRLPAYKLRKVIGYHAVEMLQEVSLKNG